jgi:transcriptional regulator with XRE-family HTH domain
MLMDDFRLGTAIRRVRQRRGWRQQDLSERSGVSQPVISRMERGHFGSQSIDRIRAVASALEIRVHLVGRWRAGDLDRLLNAGHSALHESVARMFRDELPAWILAPEVSFAIYAERGVIDILAWHPGLRALLVIELKTDLADMNELMGTLDRKRRLARQVALARGWDPLTVSAWLIISSSRTNRRRVEAHEAMLSAALPDDGRTIRAWLRAPDRPLGGLSFWTDSLPGAGRHSPRSIRRVRRAAGAVPERGSMARRPSVGPDRD